METTVCGDTSDAVAAKDLMSELGTLVNHRNRVSSDNIRYFQSILEAVCIIINNGSENSELLSDSEQDFQTSVLARIVDCYQLER